jgi:hypothetical protein
MLPVRGLALDLFARKPWKMHAVLIVDVLKLSIFGKVRYATVTV